MGEQVDLSH